MSLGHNVLNKIANAVRSGLTVGLVAGETLNLGAGGLTFTGALAAASAVLTGNATIGGAIAQTGAGTNTFVGAITCDTTITSIAGGIVADNVAEYTATAGVTIDGVLLKDGGITPADGANIILNATTGTKIGTATTQKLGFFNATPIVQPSAITQTFATADATHSARTALALTDNSAGTANTTIQALPDPTDTPATADALRDDLVAVHWPALRNNFADLAASDNAIIADLADTASLLNSVVDKLQALGLIG